MRLRMCRITHSRYPRTNIPFSLAETGAVLPIPVYVNIENEIDVGKFFFHYRSYGMASTFWRKVRKPTDHL
jgi:hypothetical protein